MFEILSSLIRQTTNSSYDTTTYDDIVIGYGLNITNEDKTLVSIPWKILNRHVYLLGATGAGKTVLLRNIAYQVVRNGWGLIYIDLKGGSGAQQAMWDIWRACVKSKREDDFNYFSPIVSGEFCRNTITWNPLLKGNYAVVADKLQDSFYNPSANASFYEDVKYDLILKLVKAFKSTGQPFTFKEISQVMSSKNALMTFAKSLKDVDAKKTIQELWNEWDANEMQFIKNTKGTVVAFQRMAMGLLKDVCNSKTPTLDLYDIIAKRQILFCYLPTMMAKVQMRSLGKMLLSELKYICSDILSYTNKRTKTVIVIDEFEELIFPAVKDLFNKAREVGISMFVGHQTLSDINYEAGSEEFSKSLMDNTGTKLIMQVKSKESAEMLSEILGEVPIKIKTPFFEMPKHIVPYDVLMGKSSLHENGLEVGEVIAKIDAELYRCKVPYPKERENIKVGVDIPYPKQY